MPVRVSLTAVEDDLLGNLHEIPDGPVRDELIAVIRELVDFARHSCCAEAQADGVPCRSVMACEDCQKVEAVVARLRRIRRTWTACRPIGNSA